MMTLRAIGHLDFHPACDTRWCEPLPRPAELVVKAGRHMPHIEPLCRENETHIVCRPCHQRMTRQPNGDREGLCACGQVIHGDDLWRITEAIL